MKKNAAVLMMMCLLLQNGTAQNVGIGITNPAAKLQINSRGNTPGLLLVDSATGFFNGGGWLRMQSQQNNRYFDMRALNGGTGANSSILLLAADSGAIAKFYSNGNVGIGIDGDPVAKLDVNGNINVANGTIKANGVAGQPGQVLGINNAGGLAWNNLNSSCYKNFAGFNAGYTQGISNATWTVPAGVTQIMVEMWSGGIGGGFNYGGNAGQYASCIIDVVPGQIATINVGRGTEGVIESFGMDSDGITGTSIAVNGKSVKVNFAGLIVSGGLRPVYLQGQRGKLWERHYEQRSSTEFIEMRSNATGGCAPKTSSSNAGLSATAYLLSGGTTVIGLTGSTQGGTPGGGGGASLLMDTPGSIGGPGMMIIYY